MPSLDPIQASQAMRSATTVGLPALLTLAAMLTVAVYLEMKERRIPNWLTCGSMGLGLLIAWWQGTPAFWSSVFGLAAGFSFLFLFYVFGGVGGGDVKLMGATGALLGLELIQPTIFYTALLGAALAVLMVVWRKDFWTRIYHGFKRFITFGKATAKIEPAPSIAIPYGLAIAAGALLTLLLRGPR